MERKLSYYLPHRPLQKKCLNNTNFIMFLIKLSISQSTLLTYTGQYKINCLLVLHILYRFTLHWFIQPTVYGLVKPTLYSIQPIQSLHCRGHRSPDSFASCVQSKNNIIHTDDFNGTTTKQIQSQIIHSFIYEKALNQNKQQYIVYWMQSIESISEM